VLLGYLPVLIQLEIWSGRMIMNDEREMWKVLLYFKVV
jgi:hypothetical protein